MVRGSSSGGVDKGARGCSTRTDTACKFRDSECAKRWPQYDCAPALTEKGRVGTHGMTVRVVVGGTDGRLSRGPWHVCPSVAYPGPSTVAHRQSN